MNAPLLESLNALAGGLFLLCAFGMVATRQTRACFRLFIAQSLLLAASAFLLGGVHASWHLAAVGLVNLVSKPIVMPLLLRRTLSAEITTRREIDQVLNIPSSLLIALALAVLAYFLTLPLLAAVSPAYRSTNVPIGFAGLFLGAYTLASRREAVPMLIGILAMENGAFFAGIALARDLPLIVELAIASDGLILVYRERSAVARDPRTHRLDAGRRARGAARGGEAMMPWLMLAIPLAIALLCAFPGSQRIAAQLTIAGYAWRCWLWQCSSRCAHATAPSWRCPTMWRSTGSARSSPCWWRWSAAPLPSTPGATWPVRRRVSRGGCASTTPTSISSSSR